MRISLPLTLICLCLAGCQQRADLYPFAEGTAALAWTISMERQTVLRQYDRSISLAQRLMEPHGGGSAREDAERIGRILQRLKSQRVAFSETSAQITDLLHGAVDYGETMALLAGVGEDGSASAIALAQTLGNMSAAPERQPDLLIGEPLKPALRRLAEAAATAAQANQLSAAINAIHPALEAVSEALQQAYVGPWQLLVSSLVSDTDELLVEATGDSVLAYYREASARRNIAYSSALQRLQTGRGLSAFCGSLQEGAVAGGCADDAEQEVLHEVEMRLASLFPAIRALELDRDTLRLWRADRRARGQLLVSAMAAWTDAHGRTGQAVRERTRVPALVLRGLLQYGTGS